MTAAMAVLAASLSAPAMAQTIVPGAVACPAERAVYEMRSTESDATWRLGLVPASNMASMASDLYLRLTTPQRHYWFTFQLAQGYGGVSLSPITDPYVDPGPESLLVDPAADLDDIGGWLRFMAFDADLEVAADAPIRGGPAPAYILLPELGLGLWYDAAALTDDPLAERDTMPPGMFRQVGCLVVPPPPALP